MESCQSGDTAVFVVINEKWEHHQKLKLKEIQTANRATKLHVASTFLADLHNDFTNILKQSKEFHNISCSNDKIADHTQNIFTNESFTTSTPVSKLKSRRNTFIYNKNTSSSPLVPISIQDSKQDRIQRHGRSKVCLKDFLDEGHLKYKNKNGHKMIINEKSPEVESTFYLNNTEFPSISEASKPKRRLHTTVVSNSKKNDESKDHNWAFQQSAIIPAPASAMPRSLWAKPPQEVADPACSKQDLAQFTNTKALKTMICEPSIRDVTDMDQLNSLADIYSYFINEGLVSNAMHELCIIIQLLTLNKIEEQGKTERRSYFTSLSNVVHFACRVLQNMSCFLESTDRQTLQLLSENERLKLFSPDLIQIILEQINILSHENPIHDEVTVCGGIHFDEDKDTRSNFPSNNAFNTFKKQRDMFYQLLREWEKEHLSIGWSIKMKIDTIHSILVGCQPTLTDHLRFVRLFVSQLIKTCTSKLSKDNSTLSELKEVNPDKLKRLQGRLVTSPPPDLNYPNFPKEEEFFRDFIALSSNNSFCDHLIIALYSKIEEYSNSFINLILNSSSNCDTTSSFQSGFLNHIATLQILGKFLGFVNFLPFRSDEKLTKDDESMLIIMRNKVLSKINVLSILKQHLHHASIIVGLSWTLHYLGLMDRSAVYLESTQSILKFLQTIHHSAFQIFPTTKPKMFVLMLRMLGWFFQLDVIPRDIFYGSPLMFEGIELERLQTSLNQHLNITNEVIFRCQPSYLEKIHYLLRHSSSSKKTDQLSKLPLRKINPKSAPLSHYFKNDRSYVNDIQKKLARAFFQMHSSLKRTVDCVFDRIFVNWINFFQSQHMQLHLQHAREFAKDFVTILSPDFDGDHLKRAINRKAEEMNNDVYWKDTSIEKFCEDAKQVLTTLLSNTTVPEVLSVFTSICCQNIKDKSSSWLKENMLPDIFCKEIITELNKQFKQREHLQCHSVHFDKSSQSLSKIHHVDEDISCHDENPLNNLTTLRMKDTNVKDVNLTGMGKECSISSCSISLEFYLNESSFTHKSNVQVIDQEKAVATLGKSQCSVAGDRTKTIKIGGDINFLLPSEVIMSTQELLLSLETKSACISVNQVLSVLQDVELILLNQYKLLHPQIGTILQSLTATLAFSIILQGKTIWDECLEEKFLTLFGGIESEAFEEIFHASNAHENPLLTSFINKILGNSSLRKTR